MSSIRTKSDNFFLDVRCGGALSLFHLEFRLDERYVEYPFNLDII